MEIDEALSYIVLPALFSLVQAYAIHKYIEYNKEARRQPILTSADEYVRRQKMIRIHYELDLETRINKDKIY